MHFLKTTLRGLLLCALIAVLTLPMLSFGGGASTLAQTASGVEESAPVAKQTSIASLIQAYAEAKGRTVMIPEEIAGYFTPEQGATITTFEGSGSEVNLENLLRLALKSRNLGMVTMGGMDVIQDINDVMQSAPVVTLEELENRQAFEVVVLPIQLKSMDANQLRSAFVNVITRGTATVQPVGRDTILLIDSVNRIREMLKLVEILDQPESTEEGR